MKLANEFNQWAIGFIHRDSVQSEDYVIALTPEVVIEALRIQFARCKEATNGLIEPTTCYNKHYCTMPFRRPLVARCIVGIRRGIEEIKEVSLASHATHVISRQYALQSLTRQKFQCATTHGLLSRALA